MRIVVRTLIAALLVAAPLAAGLALPASAQVSKPFSRTGQADSRSLTLAIDSVGPKNWAEPNSTVTVSGTITNNTGSPIPNFEVELLTSDQHFTSPSEMESYAGGNGGFASVLLQPAGETVYSSSRTLHTGTTVRWTASFTTAEADYALNGFGVYPLGATAISTSYGSYDTTLATSQTFLPYWASGGAPDRVDVSWVWPLVDNPQQGPCHDTLASNALSRGLRPGGRLGRLLSAGLRWQDTADLTWAVDPALLSDADMMTAPYKVGGNDGCTGTTAMRRNAAAGNWLTQLRSGTAGKPMFVTPYADVDVSALAHAGLNSDLQSAYTIGESVARKVLNRPFGTDGAGTGDGGAPSAAWPADGTADASVLTALANSTDVKTVLVNSAELPGASGTATSVTTGIGSQMRLLLTDSGLTSTLRSATVRSTAGSQFATEQDFLAQTAMIVAEEPSVAGRSVVVAPPARWNPSATEAGTLLSMTASAPWLRPATLSSLSSSAETTDHADPRLSLPGDQVSGAELSSGYLNQVKAAGTSLARYENLLYQPGKAALRSLRAALAATESSAWRGDGSAAGERALNYLSGFVRDAEQKVTIITGKKVLLAGASGDTPISVQNGMDAPIEVGVTVTVPPGSPLTVGKAGKYSSLIMVPAGKTGTVRVPVSSSAISTTSMQLQLVTKNGSPLTWTTQTLSVQATRYGRALLILIGAALGVLVLTSVARWLRQWLNDTRAGSGGAG
ncbi:MAG TPA: DUF6049 family protein [Trebonia sp.]|nr:DUF6049 family protein [Trebonia sp.]